MGLVSILSTAVQVVKSTSAIIKMVKETVKLVHGETKRTKESNK